MFCTRQTLWRYNKSLPYMAVKIAAAVEVVKSSQNKTGSPLYNCFCIIPSFFPITFYTFPTMHFDWQLHVGPGPLLSWPYAYWLPVMVHYGICAMVYWACVYIMFLMFPWQHFAIVTQYVSGGSLFSIVHEQKRWAQNSIVATMLCPVWKMGLSVTHLFCSLSYAFHLNVPSVFTATNSN